MFAATTDSEILVSRPVVSSQDLSADSTQFVTCVLVKRILD